MGEQVAPLKYEKRQAAITCQKRPEEQAAKIGLGVAARLHT